MLFPAFSSPMIEAVPETNTMRVLPIKSSMPREKSGLTFLPCSTPSPYIYTGVCLGFSIGTISTSFLSVETARHSITKLPSFMLMPVEAGYGNILSFKLRFKKSPPNLISPPARLVLKNFHLASLSLSYLCLSSPSSPVILPW